MGRHLGDYLKTHARTKDMSTGDFGEHVGIAKSSAAEILNGKATPSERTIRKIADAFDMPFAHLRQLALLDTPFELPQGAQLLDFEERAHVRATVTQLLKSSGKYQQVEHPEADQRQAASNVVELPLAPRVSKAAYNPPPDE